MMSLPPFPYRMTVRQSRFRTAVVPISPLHSREHHAGSVEYSLYSGGIGMKKLYYKLLCLGNWGLSLYLLLISFHSAAPLLGVSALEHILSSISWYLLILLILLGVPALYCWYKLRSSRSDDIPPEYVKRSQQLLKIVIILALVSAFAIFLLRIKAGI